MPGKTIPNTFDLPIRSSQAYSAPSTSSNQHYSTRHATLLTHNDDSIPALRSLHEENHILLLTPTTPQTHEYLFGPLMHSINKTHGKALMCMDYAPPPSKHGYLCFEERHAHALVEEGCAGVIVVVVEDGKTTGSARDFAREVACRAGVGVEMPGVMVEVGTDVRRAGRDGKWGCVVWAGKMGVREQEEVAGLILGGR